MGATAGILYGLKTIYDYTQANNQASAASQQGDFEATALRQNADLADQQAADAISRGQVEEGRIKLDTTQRFGSTMAALASQGVDVGSGSALDVQASEAGLGALDQLTVRNNAAREAWGYNVQATDYRNQATMAQVGGNRAAAGYKAQGVSALLSGAAQEVGLYSSLNRSNSVDKTDLRGSATKTSPGSVRRRGRY